MATKFTSEEIIKRLKSCADYSDLYNKDIIAKHDKEEKANYTSDGILKTEVVAGFVLQKIAEDSQFRLDVADEHFPELRENRVRDKGIPSTDMEDLIKYIYTPSVNIRERYKIEEKAVHCFQKLKQIGEYSFVDYQVPTRKKGSKIDLLLKKGENLFIVEYKKLPKYSKVEEIKVEEINFDKIIADSHSKETLLRCVLEIKTYFDRLNMDFCLKKNVKMAVMFDKHSQAYKDFCDKEKNRNVLKLMKIWDVTALELIVSQNGFNIKEII